MLRPVVSSVRVPEDMAVDTSLLWSIIIYYGLIHFKECCPWCNFALHLQVTECFPLHVHIQDIHTHIYICICADALVQAVGCQSVIRLNVQASCEVSPQI